MKLISNQPRLSQKVSDINNSLTCNCALVVALGFCFVTDVVHGDLKSTMRVLYSLFNKYKSTVTSQSEPAAEKK